MLVLTILGSLGGLATLGGAIYVVLRGAFAQAEAIRDNTAAVEDLTKGLAELRDDLHETKQDVAYLKGRASHPVRDR